MKNALIYIRVSTEEQATEGRHSLNTQLSLCKRAIDDSGIYKLAPEGVFDDPGRSATNMNRPGLQDLIIRVKEDVLVEAVFVQDTDRLARNAQDHLAIRAILQKHGTKLIAVSQPGIDAETPEGEMMDLIIAGVNQFQSKITARKTLKSMEQKFNGGWWPGLAPIGYKNAGDPKDDKKRIIVLDKDKAAFVQEAFKLYSTGDYSAVEVRDQLYQKGFLSRNERRIPMSKFFAILKNPFYTGEMRWRNLINVGKHKAVINKEVFERVQMVMKEHNRYACRRRKYMFILRGFVFCKICDQRFTAEHHIKKSISYYHCSRNKDKTKCSEPYVKVGYLENQVEELFRNIQFSSSFTEKLTTRIKSIYVARKSKIEQSKKSLYARKIAIEKKRDVAEEKLFKGIISDDDFTRVKLRYKEQIENFEEEIHKLDRKLSLKMDEVQEVLALGRDIYASYKKASPELKRLYLGLFWERFEVKEKQIVEAKLNRLMEALVQAQLISMDRSYKYKKPLPLPRKAFVPTVNRPVQISNFRGA